MVAPAAACENLQRLAAEDRTGPYGFYEAVDYTPTRLPPDRTSATIHLHGAPSGHEPAGTRQSPAPLSHAAAVYGPAPVEAADLLLQERVPKNVASAFAET